MNSLPDILFYELVKTKTMHIDEAKEIIKDRLFELGLNAFSNYKGTGDYAVYVAYKFFKISLKAKTEKFKELGGKIRDVMTENDFCKCNVMEDGTIDLINNTWEVTAKVRIKNVVASVKDEEPADNRHLIVDIPENTNGENEQMANEETPMLRINEIEVNNYLKRFGSALNRMEEVLDEFNLNKLGFRELLSQIYDALKKEGIEMYTTSSPIQLIQNTIVVPVITKETFITSALQAIKKYQLNGNK